MVRGRVDGKSGAAGNEIPRVADFADFIYTVEQYMKDASMEEGSSHRA
jgi:hypothetical protein